jgi:hypothetical protein
LPGFADPTLAAVPGDLPGGFPGALVMPRESVPLVGWGPGFGTDLGVTLGVTVGGPGVARTPGTLAGAPVSVAGLSPAAGPPPGAGRRGSWGTGALGTPPR